MKKRKRKQGRNINIFHDSDQTRRLHRDLILPEFKSTNELLGGYGNLNEKPTLVIHDDLNRLFQEALIDAGYVIIHNANGHPPKF